MYRREDPVLGLRYQKAPSSIRKISIAGVLRLHATSRRLCDRSAQRFAQDDDFVGVLTENIPNKLALMGRLPRLLSGVPSGLMQNFSGACSTASTSKEGCD